MKVEQDFKDDFSQKEWSVKFKQRIHTVIDERFSYLVKAILTVMTQNSILDTNKYEDVARELLGNEAYLLFQVDKLVNNCQKQLISFTTDTSCQAAKNLFQEFSSTVNRNENQYLSSFYQLASSLSSKSNS